MMRELHLFAGAGGGILGGMLLGHTPVGAVEIDPFARAVLHARQADGSLPDFPIYDDVRTFDGTQWRDHVDIIAGGFPCQDLSVAGKGAGIDGARSGLWWEMLRVIREARPRYVYLENVPAITGRGLDRVLGSLADLGFDAEWIVLSAADVGAPHLRKRWWCLARMADAEKWQGVGREGGDLAAAPEGRQGVHSSAVAGGEDAADSNRAGCTQQRSAVADEASDSDGKRCEKRHEEERRVSEFDANRHAMADADLAGREQQRSSVAAATARTAAERSGPAHPNSAGGRCEERGSSALHGRGDDTRSYIDGLCARRRWEGPPECADGLTETQPRMGRAADGLAAWLDAGRRLHGTAWQEGWEDDCPRVVFGKTANRTNRLKALGNGQVPQTAAAAFRILWERLHA